jgi:peptidoglycan-associated lipoprotein
MKKKIILIGISVVLIFSLIIINGCAINRVTGCAEKKSEVTSGTSKLKHPANRVTAEALVRDINFDFDSSNIRPDALDILKINANYLLKKRVSSIVIEGHCDERGTAEYNMALGERRAQATKKSLVNLGLKKSIIKTVSYGKERPLDPASNEKAWAKNRRAHFVITP